MRFPITASKALCTSKASDRVDAFFIFKRTMGMLLQPLPVVFCLALLGLILVGLTRRKKLGRFVLFLSFLVLFAVSFPPLIRLMAKPLEGTHPPLFADAAAKLKPWAVVVMGSGVAHPSDPGLPAMTRLNDCARARLVEGLRVGRLFPDAEFVVTGYGMGLENCADAMAAAAGEMGVAKDRIHALANSLDSEDEARQVKELAAGREIVLVTSAAHMPRAMLFFQQAGVNAVPAPCDYISSLHGPTRDDVNRSRWRPRGESLAHSEELWHEFAGLAYLYVKSMIPGG